MDLAAQDDRDSLRRGAGRRFATFLAAVAALLAVLVAVGLIRLAVTEDALEIRVAENHLWSAAQAETELVRFLELLALYVDADPSTPRAALAERFDILWSRVGLYQAGELRVALSGRPDLQAGMQRFATVLERVDGLLANLQPGDVAGARRIRTELIPFQALSRQVSLYSMEHDLGERTSLRAGQHWLRWQILVLGGALLAAGMALVAYLWRSERRARSLLAAARAARSEADRASARLLEVVERLNQGFVYYDAEDRLTLCNSKYREIYADSRDLIVPGRTFEEIIRAGAERGQYEAAIGRVDAWVGERLARRQDDEAPHEQALGDGRWVLVSDRHTRDGGIVGIRTDITDLKLRELLLAEATARLERQAGEMERLAQEAEAARAHLVDAIESIDEGFSIYDADDRLVLCNQRYKALHAMLGERLQLGIRFVDLIRMVAESGAIPGIGDAGAFACERAAARRTSALRQFEEQHDGHWLRISNRPTRSGGVVSVFTDLTELKAIQERLRLSQDRLRATVDAAFDPIIVMDSHGRVIDYNSAAVACFGHSREHAIGQMLGPLMVPERYREAHRQGLERYHATGHGPVLRKRIEIEALRADRSEFPVELAIDVAQGEDGEIFVAYLRDITDRREADAAMRQAKERAEEANRAKSAFLAR